MSTLENELRLMQANAVARQLQKLCKSVRSQDMGTTQILRGALQRSFDNVTRTHLSTPLDVAEEEFIKSFILFLDTRNPPPKAVVLSSERVEEEPEEEDNVYDLPGV